MCVRQNKYVVNYDIFNYIYGGFYWLYSVVLVFCVLNNAL